MMSSFYYLTQCVVLVKYDGKCYKAGRIDFVGTGVNLLDFRINDIS